MAARSAAGIPPLPPRAGPGRWKRNYFSLQRRLGVTLY